MSDGYLNILRVFYIDDQEFLNKDIYQYIKEHVFDNKEDEFIIVADVINFFKKEEKVKLAMKKLNLDLQEMVYYTVKYFNKQTHVQYHPAALAKNLKRLIDNYD